jgi:molybdopterin molybdotransferase
MTRDGTHCNIGVMKPAPITVEEAQRRLAAEVPSPADEEVALADALGAALAEDVTSDVDMPPFDRALMDGYAVIAADTPGELDVVEQIPAGHAPTRRVARGQCAKIMTGAPVPEGADAVQQVEKTNGGSPRVRILEAATPGKNVGAKASDFRRGAVALARGTLVRPQEIAVLATVGRTRVRTYRRPSCAMFATGDELVEPPAAPGPGQIRNSNAHSVAAQVRTLGLACDVLPIAHDAIDELRARVRAGLERDVLLISGGVSAGDWDLVIPALEAEGVSCVLHQVLLRPGRPFYFGRRERKVVFALPGNPVSSFVTFEVFVRPFLLSMIGATSPRRTLRARLAEALPKLHDRQQYLPALVEGDSVRALPWGGSGDIFALSRANALVIQPIQTALRQGDVVDVILI